MSLSLRDITLALACLIYWVDGKRIQTADNQAQRYPSAECWRPLLMVDSMSGWQSLAEDPVETLAAFLLSVNPASAFMRCSRPAAMSLPASNPSRAASLKVPGARHRLGRHSAIPCNNNMVMLAAQNITADSLGWSLQQAIASALTTEEKADQSANQPTNQPANHTAKQAAEEVGNQEASRLSSWGNQEASRLSRWPPTQPAKQTAEEVRKQESSRPTNQPPTQPAKQPAEEADSQASGQPTGQPAKQPDKPKADAPNVAAAKVDDQIKAAMARARAKLAAQEVAQDPYSHWKAKKPNQTTVQPDKESTSQPFSQPASPPAIQSSSKPPDQEISPPTSQTSSQPASQLTSQASSQPTTQADLSTSETSNPKASQSENETESVFEQRLIELYDLIDWRQKVLGKEHEDTLKAMSEVADIKGELGLLDEAVILKGEVFDIMRRVMGLGRTDTLHAMHSYILTLEEAGRHNKAEKLRREFDQNVFWECSLANKTANDFSAAGLHVDAVPLRKDLYAFFDEIFGPDNPRTISAGVTYADELSKMGCHAEVAPLRKHLLKMTLQTLGPDHPDTLKAKKDYEQALFKESEACELPDDYEIIEGGGFSIKVPKDDDS